MKQRLASILAGVLLVFAYYFIPWPSDAKCEARWHELKTREALHDFEQGRHDDYGDPPPKESALTADEDAELATLNNWAESPGRAVSRQPREIKKPRHERGPRNGCGDRLNQVEIQQTARRHRQVPPRRSRCHLKVLAPPANFS